ncbi:regulator [Paenibacillus montaniterrae]|uniref:Regulator n=1 Tax=Paenibacillus montaniterrae TaxID=429341 RepID=A0A919YJ85_9BACL|nr:YlbF family regulator [Paenibacillus montaniterrae]GIP14460.1 regulator [Paenibacillus montaniterrae]
MYEYGQAVATEPGTASIDMASLLLKAYELGDTIIASAPVANYLYWQAEVAKNTEVKSIQREFQRAKELFEETQRFGRFHPNYHEAKDRVKAIEAKLNAIPCVQAFKQHEAQLDELLHEVATMIARSVSDTIKVPSNEKGAGGGCGSGGSCSCGSGGCG